MQLIPLPPETVRKLITAAKYGVAYAPDDKAERKEQKSAWLDSIGIAARLLRELSDD